MRCMLRVTCSCALGAVCCLLFVVWLLVIGVLFEVRRRRALLFAG